MKTADGSYKNYSTITKKMNGKVFRIYPELIKSELYKNVMKQLENKKKSEKDEKYNAEFDSIIEKHMKK